VSTATKIEPVKGTRKQKTSARMASGADNRNRVGLPTTQPLTAVAGDEPNRVTIHVDSFMMQYPFGQVAYNSGAIVPLLDSTLYYVYCDDPHHRGGAQTYLVSTRESDLFAAEGRVYIGMIATPVIGGSSENARSTSGQDIASSTNERESRIRPLLDTKGWSTHDWAVQSGLDFHTASDYLKGKKNSYPSTRIKLARSLGIDVADLPR
jgi:hypothetical protein